MPKKGQKTIASHPWKQRNYTKEKEEKAARIKKASESLSALLLNLECEDSEDDFKPEGE